MRILGLTYATQKPVEIDIKDTKVFLAEDIQKITKVDDQGNEYTEYEFNYIEYDKNEYIELMAKKNIVLEEELTETQLALIELYQKVGI